MHIRETMKLGRVLKIKVVNDAIQKSFILKLKDYLPIANSIGVFASNLRIILTAFSLSEKRQIP